MTDTREEQVRSALLVVADRAALYGKVARWLMHDLRGPAQALALVSDLLDGGDDMDEPAVRLSVQEASERLRDILELLDEVLRIPAPDEAPGPVSLREPLALVCRLVGLQRSGITLDAEPALTARLPAVRAVEGHLQHALLAVLMNACEAQARRSRGAIRISAEADGRTVRLAVEDDGPGVPAVVAPRLFDPFVTTRADRPLAGLGLHVARGLLERVGGTVRHEPREGGARFVLELPVWT